MTKNFRKASVITLVFFLFLSIITGCSSAADGYAYPKLELNLNSIFPDNNSKHEGAKKFAEEVSKATGGAITIAVYPNDQLAGGNQSKAIEMVRNGSIDMDLHSAMIFSSLNGKFSVLNLPFLVSSAEEGAAKLDGAGGEALGALLEESGIHLLGFFENGMYQLTTSGKLVKNVNDLKGLKIRVAPVPLYLDSFAAMGANPISMNFSEVYTALQQGTIDGHVNDNENIKLQGFYEVQEYVTEWNCSYDPVVLCINKTLWDSFAPEVQQAISESAKKASNFQRELARNNNKTALNELVADGLVERYVPTPEELAGFKAACEPVIAKYREQFGAEFMKAFE